MMKSVRFWLYFGCPYQTGAMKTKNTILSLLRRQNLTVNELADRLGVTRNAIIIPLKQLEADGLVEGKSRRGSGAGKPPTEFGAVAGTEDSDSGAYKPFLQKVINTLPSYLERHEIEKLMGEIGSSLAQEVKTDTSDSFEARLDAALQFLDGIGAGTSKEETETHITIRSYSCPLGRAVREDPCVCSAMERFFADVTGGDVREECKRDGRLLCQFIITPKD